MVQLGKRQQILNRLVERTKKDLVNEILKMGPKGLQGLMVKNAYEGGLSKKEYDEAETLIDGLPLGQEDCWVCPSDDKGKRKGILDYGICRGHAHYALITRK